MGAPGAAMTKLMAEEPKAYTLTNVDEDKGRGSAMDMGTQRRESGQQQQQQLAAAPLTKEQLLRAERFSSEYRSTYCEPLGAASRPGAGSAFLASAKQCLGKESDGSHLKQCASTPILDSAAVAGASSDVG